MTAQKRTVGDVVHNVSNRLSNINAMVRLCGFAAEARRTLGEIQEACVGSPDICQQLDLRVETRNEWGCHQDTLAIVLKEIAIQIDQLNDALDDPAIRLDLENLPKRHGL